MRGLMMIAAILMASVSAEAQSLDGASCTATTPDAAGNLLAAVAAIGAAATQPPAVGSASCGSAVRTIGRSTVSRGPNGALSFRSGLAIDADGAPNAYAPGNRGIDWLANAGHPGNWYGIVTKNGKPVVQGPNDPFPGFYVSPTSLRDPKQPSTSPKAYVDATAVPFLAVPPELLGAGAKLGDVAAVSYNGKTVYAILADVGPRGKLGEGSVALAKALGLPSSPKAGGLDARNLQVVVFPKTGDGVPLSVDEINRRGAAALQKQAAACAR